MVAPKETVWPLEPHTAAKHAILSRYLAAWLPILSQGGFPRLAYIDAFSGPGSYSGGEDGSPIIALKAMLDHRANIRAQCYFDFVERAADRAEALRSAVAQTQNLLGKPSNAHVEVHQSTFEEAYGKIGPRLRAAGRIPTFAFIDPFGWTGLPFSIVEELLQRPSTEVFINFMFEEINRFLDHPDQIDNFDKLFGCTEWRACVNKSGTDRNKCLRDLYARKLGDSARYVRYFEMRNRSNSTDYFLFFATNSLAGLKKMKEAMWKVDQGGAFSFSDATNSDQMTIFTDEPNFEQLRREILAEFAGKAASVAEIEEFVLTRTAFRETHFKRQVLAKGEGRDFEVVRSKSDRRRGTFPPETVLQFA